MNKLRFLAALPLLLAGFGITAPAADNITTPEQVFPQLDAILKQAVAQSPGMINRAIDLELAEQGRISARSGMLPAVGGFANFFRSRDDRADLNEIVNADKVYYSFSVSQPVYHWGERRNYARLGEIRQRLAQGNYLEAYRKYAQEVRALYLRLVIDKLRVERSAFHADLTEKQRKQGEVRLNAKAVSEAQMFSIRMEAERAQIVAERAVFDFETDKVSFARLTGQPVLRSEEIPNNIPPVTVQDQAIQQLLAGYLAQKDLPTTEAAVYRKSLEIEEIGLAIAKVRLRPKINAQMGITQDEQSYKLSTEQKYAVKSLYAGIALNWSIFDGFAAGAAVRSSQLRLRQMKTEYRDLTEKLSQQAQTQVKLLGFQSRYVSMAERYLGSSEGNLQVKKAEHARGVISEEDLGAAQINLYDTQMNAFTNRADYYAQVCEFLGTVMEDPVLRNLPQDR